MTDNQGITFFDIASAQPLRTFAPNPWKTRFALNAKHVSYRTEWVQMPDITSVRTSLGIAANRTLPDGSPFHTLPVIKDSQTGKIVGDTFEIALYLDRTYPESGLQLFKPNTVGLTAAWNAQVDSLFTRFAGLATRMPFDPAVQDAVNKIFAKRFGVSDLSVLQPSAEQRAAQFVEFEAALGELSKAYSHTGGTTDHVWRKGGTLAASSQEPGRSNVGPFLDGDEPSYADFIIGAWLNMMEKCLETDEWQRMRSWQGGLWGRIVDALQPWCEIK